MDQAIINEWNNNVDDDDKVCVVGDFSLCSTNKAIEYVKQLNGSITLIVGNHDAPFLKPRRAVKYLDAGMGRVTDVDVTRINDSNILVHHFPYKGDPDERFHELRYENDGDWLIHGHVHDIWLQKGKQINVGIDAWGGKLVPIEKLQSLVSQGPADIACDQWHD